MRHEARCRQLEGKLLSHSPKIGWRVHRTSHVLLRLLDICVRWQGITDVGQDCLRYHMRHNFIEDILLQREVLNLIRLTLGFRNGY